MISQPLVSCIMPTANRQAFVPRAIEYFLRQDYPNHELLIADDGVAAVAGLVPDDPHVRYLRLEPGLTLGAKRNRCVELAQGDLIMHWDDDDWMAPHRIRYQVEELLHAGAEVCSLRRMLWYDIASGQVWLYQYPNNRRPWLAGNALLYTRSFWQRAPFPDLQVGSDTRFVFSQPLDRAVALPDFRFYIGLIHPNNTSPKQLRPPLWSPWSGDLRAIMGSDLDFYQQLPEQLASAAAPGDDPAAVAPRPPDAAHAGDSARQANSATLPRTTQRYLHIPTRRAVPEMVSEPPVSVCLLSYKRPQHLQRIVDSLHGYRFVDEILVWNNNPEVQLTLHGDKVRVIDAQENMMCFGRFLCAKAARNSIIYVQDDDVIVRNVASLYRSFLADDGCITHALSPQHFAQRDRTHYADCHLALLGWGSFFRKEWLAVLDQYLADDGDSLLFRREADKFFALLLAKTHNTLLGDLHLLEHHATPGVALYLEPDHQRMTALAVRRALGRLREARGVRFPVTWNVVIPCHNYGRYLREAVHSVLLSDADYVVTIVDDASSDETEQVSRELCDRYPWINYIRYAENVGVSRARNSGIAAVDSLFVILLDADDKIGPHYLFEAERMLRSGCDIVNPDAILFGDTVSRWPVPDTVSLPMLLERNPVHCSSAFRLCYWGQVGGIDEQIPGWEDYEFWIRLAAAGARIYRIPGDHFFYRQHGPSRSTRANTDEDLLRQYLRRKHIKLYDRYPMKPS